MQTGYGLPPLLRHLMSQPKVVERKFKGRRFGRLKILAIESAGGHRVFKCKCKCGCVKAIRASSVTSGVTRSCGCLRDETSRESLRKIKAARPGERMRGRRFGRLKVLGESTFRDAHRHRHWHCRCDCGAEKVVRAQSLRGGLTTSCGCLASERLAAGAARLAERQRESDAGQDDLRAVARCGGCGACFFMNAGHQCFAVGVVA